MSTAQAPIDSPPVRIWRRVFLAIGLFIVAVIGLGVARMSYTRARTERTLQAVITALDETDPGWRLEEILAARAVPLPNQDSAKVVVRVSKLLGNWPTAHFDDRFQSVAAPELLDDERAKLLDDEMTRLQPAVAEARRMATMPQGRHHLAIGPNPFETLLPDQQDTRRSATLLRYDAWNQAQKRDLQAALLAARACFNAGRSLDDEPIVISQLVRVACLSIACSSVERSLALGEAADADLALVQELLRLEQAHPTLLVCMRGERALQQEMFKGMLSGAVPTKRFFEGMLDQSDLTLRERIFGYSPTEIKRQQAQVLAMMQELIDAAKLPSHEQDPRVRALDAKVKALPATDRLARLLMPAMASIARAFRRKEASVAALDALLAVERYRLKHGQWPEKLDNLPKALLPAIPLDPYDGKPLRYARTAEGVVVYSVYENGRDDGGQVQFAGMGGLPPDWGYRLWDVKRRRQPPAPEKPK